MLNLRNAFLFLVLLPGCLLGWKGYEPTADGSDCSESSDTATSADTNADTAIDTAGETEDSATDSGDSATDTVTDTGEAGPCDTTACERRLRDADGDTYGNPDDCLFVPPETAWESGYVQWITGRDDCDDTDATVHPDATEVCNGFDDNCDGAVDEKSTWYADGDGDGYGDPAISVDACDQPAGYVANGDDCNDWNVEQNPSVTEYCNGADDDCDGVIPADELDADGDGFNGCTASPDCDDTNAAISPVATEFCDGSNVDEDCDGLVNDADPSMDPSGRFLLYHDADGDGFGDKTTEVALCQSPDSSWIGDNTDCDDTDPNAYPGHGC